MTTPDGQFAVTSGGYGASTGGFNGQSVYTMSGVVEAVVAGYNSGPSAYGTIVGIPQLNQPGVGDNIAISWTGTAEFAVYNATSVGSEVQARFTTADSDTFKVGYGSGTSAFGIGDAAVGDGVPPRLPHPRSAIRSGSGSSGCSAPAGAPPRTGASTRRPCRCRQPGRRAAARRPGR